MSSYGNYPEQPSHGQQSPYGSPPAYGTQPPAYGTQPGYGQQPAPYGSPPAYGTHAGYPQPYGYGGGQPVRSGGVTAAAVLGFILGAGGVVVSLVTLIGAFAVLGASGSGEFSAIPGLSDIAGAAGGILVFVALLAIAWTVLIILGGVRALTGRSRVPLIVAGSMSIAFGLLVLIGGLGDDTGDSAGGIVFGLVTLAAAVAIVVLLSVTPATAFFQAKRAQRGG